MHAAQLIEITSTYVRLTRAHLAHRQSVRPEAAHAYWLTNRFRHEYWSGRLAAHRAAIQRPGVRQRNLRWLEITPVIQEVLLSEPLARCVAYHGKLLEDQGIDDELAPLAQSTLAAQVEARHRCLHLIVFGTGLSPELAVKLNRLRRLLELFNDQLISSMLPLENLDLYCFDGETVQASHRRLQRSGYPSGVGRFHAAMMSRWVYQAGAIDIEAQAANARLNQRLSEVILEMFPGDSFDSFGLPRSQEAIWCATDSSESGEHAVDPKMTSPFPLQTIGNSSKRDCLPEPSDRRW